MKVIEARAAATLALNGIPFAVLASISSVVTGVLIASAFNIESHRHKQHLHGYLPAGSARGRHATAFLLGLCYPRTEREAL